jgi:hypothetical protein
MVGNALHSYLSLVPIPVPVFETPSQPLEGSECLSRRLSTAQRSLRMPCGSTFPLYISYSFGLESEVTLKTRRLPLKNHISKSPYSTAAYSVS